MTNSQKKWRAMGYLVLLGGGSLLTFASFASIPYFPGPMGLFGSLCMMPIGLIPLVLVILKCFKNAEPVGDCPNCDYDLTGTRQSRKLTCPECGHDLTARD